MSDQEKYPDREYHFGEPCPWCKAIIDLVLTSAPPRCVSCKGLLGRPVWERNKPPDNDGIVKRR